MITSTNSKAAKDILEMGFSVESLSSAIEQLRMERYSGAFSKETLLDFMLEGGFDMREDFLAEDSLPEDLTGTSEAAMYKEPSAPSAPLPILTQENPDSAPEKCGKQLRRSDSGQTGMFQRFCFWICHNKSEVFQNTVLFLKSTLTHK